MNNHLPGNALPNFEKVGAKLAVAICVREAADELDMQFARITLMKLLEMPELGEAMEETKHGKTPAIQQSERIETLARAICSSNGIAPDDLRTEVPRRSVDWPVPAWQFFIRDAYAVQGHHRPKQQGQDSSRRPSGGSNQRLRTSQSARLGSALEIAPLALQLHLIYTNRTVISGASHAKVGIQGSQP